MPEIKDIELRSDRVRKIVGKIPPAIDRYGISVIGLLLVVMVGVKWASLLRCVIWVKNSRFLLR